MNCSAPHTAVFARSATSGHGELSSPETAQRSCVLVIHPQITSEVFKGKEGRIVFPDRPTEYPCR